MKTINIKSLVSHKKRMPVTVGMVVLLTILAIALYIFVVKSDNSTNTNNVAKTEVVPPPPCTYISDEIITLTKTNTPQAIEAYKKIQDPCTLKEQYADKTYEQKAAQFEVNYELAKAISKTDKDAALKTSSSALAVYGAMSENERTQLKGATKVVRLSDFRESLK